MAKNSLRLRLFVAPLVVAAVLIVWYAVPRSNPVRASKDSVARFASDDFVAAYRLEPRALYEHDYFGALPIEAFLPARLSLYRLGAANVEELAVFCKPATDSATGAKAVEWAVAARTSQPLRLDDAVRQARSLLETQSEELELQSSRMTIAGRDCYRVPTGSFLTPRRTFGRLRFIDKQGQAVDSGINVGEPYPRRSYIEGATRASAVFTFEDVSEETLVDDQLRLEIRPRIFRTHFVEGHYRDVRIELRNPDTGVRSAAIVFKATSYANHRLEIARAVTLAGAKEVERADLLNDLVSNGRLEVVLKLSTPRVYLGLAEGDLNILPEAYEYVRLQGREVLVAQSTKTLADMLQAAKKASNLAQRLAPDVNELVIAARVRDEQDRVVLQQAIRTLRIEGESAELMGDAISELRVSVDVSSNVDANVEATFTDRKTAKLAMDQLQASIRDAKSSVQARIKNALGRLGARAALISIALDAISMRFPENEASTFDERTTALSSMIDDSLDGITIKRSGRQLRIAFKQPDSTDQLPEMANIAVANLDEVFAHNLFAREKFELCEDRYKRVTNRFPSVSQVWFRRSHQIAYNTSANFDGAENRYAWIRKGVELLLDGAEQNSSTTDLTWMAARLIGGKIGASDDRVAHRQLFSNDDRLHKRIGAIMDLEMAQSAVHDVDNWLVAKRLFEHCIERQQKTANTSSIPPLLFHSRPAATQARYAQALNEAGRWSEANAAWKLAEELHLELGATTIVLGESTVRLGDLPDRLAELGPDHAAVRRLKNARKRIRFDDWLSRCRLEQSDEVRSARRLTRRADERRRESELDEARDLYRQALQLLAGLQETQPAQAQLFAGEFRDLARDYRSVTEPNHRTDPSIDSILTLIERSRPISQAFLNDISNEG